jgi:hypothetical protein
MNRILSALAAMILLACLAPASAQQAINSKEALIRELLQITGSEALMQQQISQFAPQIIASIKPAFPTVPETLWSEFQVELVADFRAEIPAFVAASAKVYDKHYSEAELKDLVGFYKTPTGRKTLSVLPQIMAETSAAGMAWGREIGQRSALRAMDKLKAKGYQPKQL